MNKKYLPHVLLTGGFIIAGLLAYNLLAGKMDEMQENNPVAFAIVPSIAIIIGCKILFLAAARSRRKKKVKVASYNESRQLWMNIVENDKASFVHEADDTVLFTAMEFSMSLDKKTPTRAVVFAGKDGDASFYFESYNNNGAGGFIGGMAHENIAEPAKLMVAVASYNIRLMQRSSNFPFASNGKVSFLAVTKNAKYSAQVPDEGMENGDNPWHKIFLAGHEIIAGFRKIDQEGAQNG